MDVDLIGPDVDALDQAGEDGTLPCSRQLGPALSDLRGAGDEPALRRQIRAFAETQGFCIHDHIVTEDGCRLHWLYFRVVPSHAIQLAAVYLDRNVAKIVAEHIGARPNPEHKRGLSAIIHLCGAGVAKAFAQRGYRLLAGERCGEHFVTTYLARVKAMEREFRRLASGPPWL